MKNKLQILILSFGLFQLCILSGFSQIIADGTYQIYSETHDATLESPTDVNQDDSGNGQINNLFGSTSDVNNDYQLFEFIHQGSDIYKIKTLGTDQFIGIKDNWCGNGGEVIARYAETDNNVEFSVSQDAISGQFIIQIAFTNCNFGSVNDPARSFDLGSSTGSVRTFGDTGGNQQFRLKSISPAVTNGTYRIFTDATNSFIESPVNVNQDDSGDATVNNLFAAALDEASDFQKFQFTYHYTNQNGDIYSIRNLGTNQYVGLKDNFCGDFGEVIARFAASNNEAQIVISINESSDRVLFQKDANASCSYFDLTGAGKIRTFNDTGFNQQFRVIPVSTFIYDGTWSPSVPVGGEDVFVLDNTYTINSDISLNSILVSSDASVVVSADNTISVAESLNNRGNFTFQSDASGSAQLGNAENLTIIGELTTERFIPSRSDNARAFRFLASPVGNVNIVDAWQGQTHITGINGAANGFDPTQTNNPSMFNFDHTEETQNQPWVAVTTTNQDILAGKPYRLFIRGDRNVILTNNEAAANDVTLSAKGLLHTGNFSVETSNFPENYSFVGNPYQAVVDLNNLTYGDGVNVNFAYYWDPTLENAGGFVTITLPSGAPNPGSSNANQFLRPGQAVFLQNNTTGTDYSIQFTESSKATSEPQTQVFSAEEPTKFVNLRIYKTEKFNNGETEEDAFGFRFSETGNNQIDQFDASKMGNPGINLASVNTNKLLAIESRSIPDETEELQLFMNNLDTDNYTFRLHGGNLPENVKLFLNDSYLNTSTEIVDGFETYSFSADEAIPESVDVFRFYFSFENETLSNVENEIDAQLTLYPNPTENLLNITNNLLQNESLNVQVFDIQGRKLVSQNIQANEAGQLQLNTSKLSSGMYTLKIQNKNGINLTEKFIKN